MEEPLVYSFFNDDELLRISNLIKDVEMTTSGEICVSIKESRNFKQRKKSIKEIAEEEFIRLGINKTREATGILIMLLLEERQFYILADDAINKKVSPETWEKIKDKMENFFSVGKFSEGVLYAVEDVGKILSEHFPVKPDDVNEISNRVIIR